MHRESFLFFIVHCCDRIIQFEKNNYQRLNLYNRNQIDNGLNVLLKINCLNYIFSSI